MVVSATLKCHTPQRILYVMSVLQGLFRDQRVSRVSTTSTCIGILESVIETMIHLQCH